MVKHLKDRKILIAGLGVSGLEAALLASERGASVVVLDSTQPTEDLQKRSTRLAEKGIKVLIAANPLKINLPFKPEFIVISPGIDPRNSFGRYLHALSCPVISELEFAASLTRIPLIGISGTNGKTTTVEIITHCLNNLGKKAIAAGNIGLALSQVVRENDQYDFIVVEISSFQLEATKNIAFIAVGLLNISSDHIDRYTSFNEYRHTKLKLLRYSKNIVLTSDVAAKQQPISHKPHTTIVGTTNEGLFDIYFNDPDIFTSGEHFDYATHPLSGRHNAINLMVAMSILKHCGFKLKEAYEASITYRPALHRLQYIMKYRGVEIYNDSKATNPHALLMALESLGKKQKKNIVLVAGGKDKKMDFTIVKKALCSYTKGVYLYGECRLKIYESWKHKVSCNMCESFSAAVSAALCSVKRGEVLLLSPACSSLDSFTSYKERGNEFVRIVQEWTTNEK